MVVLAGVLIMVTVVGRVVVLVDVVVSMYTITEEEVSRTKELETENQAQVIVFMFLIYLTCVYFIGVQGVFWYSWKKRKRKRCGLHSSPFSMRQFKRRQLQEDHLELTGVTKVGIHDV